MNREILGAAEILSALGLRLQRLAQLVDKAQGWLVQGCPRYLLWNEPCADIAQTLVCETTPIVCMAALFYVSGHRDMLTEVSASVGGTGEASVLGIGRWSILYNTGLKTKDTTTVR